MQAVSRPISEGRRDGAYLSTVRAQIAMTAADYAVAQGGRRGACAAEIDRNTGGIGRDVGGRLA